MSEPVLEKDVGARLLGLLSEERRIRAERLRGPEYFDADLSELEQHHSRVAREISGILERWSWPGILLVGQEGASAAAELASSCWSEPSFMRLCLPQIEQAWRFGDIWGEWFARMYDTVMYLENKPQVFGMVLDWNEEGRFELWRLVDPENVELRRKPLMVPPLETYVGWKVGDSKALLPPRDPLAYREALNRWAGARGWRREK